MNKKYTTDQKQELVARYHNGESVSNLCFKANIARSTFYTWIRGFEKISSASKKSLTLIDVNYLKRQLDKKETIIQILKSVGCTTSAPLKEKLYELEKLKDKYNTNILCEALEVDKGTFYNHILRNKKQDTMYKRRREEVGLLVREIYDESNQIYGANKIHAILKERAIEASPEYIRGIMNELGLKSIRTNAKKDYLKLNAKKKSDLLRKDFTATRPNEIWVSDTTCFKLQGKWYYICAILDLYSRRVVAYKISPKHSTNLITGTFKSAYSIRNPKDLTFHSDRGSQYTSQAFMLLLKNLSIAQSFSPSGKPCHNAVMESFFSTLKKEEIYRTNYTSSNHFKENIEKYILFYNDNRPHSTINHHTPNAFEQAFFNRKSK